MPQIADSRTRFEARIDPASISCLNHDPRFGLSGLARRNQVRVRIAGMHLHGKHLARVQELEEQRKAAEAGSQLAHQWFPELFHQVADGLPLKGSVGNLALMIVAVAEQPRFANRTVTRQRRGEQAGQTPAAPQPILINWLEAQGIQRNLTHALSSNSRVHRPVLRSIRSILVYRGAFSIAGEYSPRRAAWLQHAR